MAIPCRLITLATKFNHLTSLRTRAQSRSFFTSIKRTDINRTNAIKILLKSCESHLNGLVSESRYGTSDSNTDDVLSRDAMSHMLAKYAGFVDIEEKSIKYIETNQLPANVPMEDMHAEGRLLTNDGFLFGVFDGHEGESCAQYVSECLFIYLANYLATNDNVTRLMSELNVDSNKPFYSGSIEWISSLPNIVVPPANEFLRENLLKITNERSETDNTDLQELIKAAFVRMDLDLTNGPLIKTLSSQLRSYLINPASSGSCANVAYINDRDLYVANAGDCRAVIGATNENGEITAKEITRDHSYKNADEVKRLLDVRPQEFSTVMEDSRLLGMLSPLRGFGDVDFKWSIDDLKNTLLPSFPDIPDLIPPNYLTPPYLTAEPEVFHHQLTKDDKFLILATDGLWNVIPSSQAVKLIDQHSMQFKGTSRDIAGTSVSYEESDVFCDRNGATYLIRNALGLLDDRVSLHLKLSPKFMRDYRDDITVTIVYFDDNY